MHVSVLITNQKAIIIFEGALGVGGVSISGGLGSWRGEELIIRGLRWP